jgi:putative sigma-54 modulation protein
MYGLAERRGNILFRSYVFTLTEHGFYTEFTMWYNERAKEECFMNLSIRGQHIDVTEALHDYVDKKLTRLEKYFDAPPSSDGHVTLNVAKGTHKVEVTIPLPHGLLRAENKSDDMYASIDGVVDKLERQIRKYKTKLNRKFREEGIKGHEPASTTAAIDTDSDAELHDDSLEIVRTKQFDLKPMTAEEAILQMGLLGHTFFVFTNTETKDVNVVYKRHDGRYGLITHGY